MTIYRERLWASAWVFISTALVIPASLMVFLPINIGVGVIVAIVLYGGCVFLLIATAPVIEVTPEEFRAGRARLPIRFLGPIEGFRTEEATLERGQRLDSRAWLLIRGWVGPIVRIDVLDENDPTPYWVVSTRHPEDVVAAVARARATA
ncbi:DUF3093 domain-containing protein [Glaciihabitans sp. UYNi722]|uniref:DUF3093 domain-containing protein n=1 Tax=Glaciihabitans sp. UYNi722 TaxID=3156344 RepID=UPI00339A89D1